MCVLKFLRTCAGDGLTCSNAAAPRNHKFVVIEFDWQLIKNENNLDPKLGFPVNDI